MTMLATVHTFFALPTQEAQRRFMVNAAHNCRDTAGVPDMRRFHDDQVVQAEGVADGRTSLR
ncbi:MAG TPA: hypothetical protein VFZ32_13175 [Micromonosporaceae bacterium]